MLKLFDLLRAAGDDLDPKECKLYLTVPRALDRLREGRFERDWLCLQNKRIFSRSRVVALVDFRATAEREWLFLGCWDSSQPPVWDAKANGGKGQWKYALARREQTRHLAARVLVSFDYTSQSRCLNAEGQADKLLVAEISREQTTVAPFPGFMEVSLSYSNLRGFSHDPVQGWKTALSVVRGIYVITDESAGKLYIGKADGKNGIWGRWMAYAESGHGGNVELRKLLREKGKDYARHFRFSILETADARADSKHLDARESHWKNVFQTRAHGYNEN